MWLNKRKNKYKYLQSYTHEPSKTIDFLYSTSQPHSFYREWSGKKILTTIKKIAYITFFCWNNKQYIYIRVCTVMRVDQFPRIIACFCCLDKLFNGSILTCNMHKMMAWNIFINFHKIPFYLKMPLIKCLETSSLHLNFIHKKVALQKFNLSLVVVVMS